MLRSGLEATKLPRDADSNEASTSLQTRVSMVLLGSDLVSCNAEPN